MGKLAHIKTAMSSTSMMDGMVQAVGAYIAQVVADKLSQDMSRGGEGLNQVKAAVGALEPSITAAVKSAVGEIVQSLATHHEATKRELQSASDKLTGTQRSLMQSFTQALTQVKIPDYSESLKRIEGKAVDLSPVERQLEAVLLKLDIDKDDDPKQWKFTVKRNSRGLIETVTATAEE